MKQFLKISIVFLLFMLKLDLHAQSEGDANLQKYESLELIKAIEDKYNVKFRYKQEWFQSNQQFELNIGKQKLEEVLEKTFVVEGYSYLMKSPNYVVLFKDSPEIMSLELAGEEGQTEVLTLGKVGAVNKNAILKGLVTSSKEGEPLPGVTVLAKEINKGTVTNGKGEYALELPSGFHTITYQSIETGKMELSIVLNSSSTLNIQLFEDMVQLNEVVVTAKSIKENIEETVTGKESITLKEIEQLPAFLGEKDVIKSITSLPGVNLTGEASSGYNVRGSGVGANLVLLDDGVIFNSSHLFGFFTAFSSDLISGVDLYKGAIPAKFGGRIASVLEVEIKDGNKQKVSGSGGAGVISSRFNIEAPIIKDKSSIILGLRAAYPNYLMRAVNNADLKRSRALFGDGTLKYDHLLNENNRISFTAYGSGDEFEISNSVSYNYYNSSGTFYWNHNFTDRSFFDLTYNLSQYNYNLEDNTDEQEQFSLFASVNNHKLNTDFSLTSVEDHVIEYGLHNVYYTIQPGRFNNDSTSVIFGLNDLPLETALESAIYLSDKWKINDQIAISGGLRYSNFLNLMSENSKNYGGLEPRFSFNYQLDQKNAIKFGYNRMRQYIHLISNTASVTPVDIWKLSSNELRPTISDQISLGFFKNFQSNTIESYVEVYYKTIQDLIEYKNAANLFANENLTDELLQGKGLAYGAEFYIKKNRGKLNGWISYTYSRSFIQVKGQDQESTINQGNYFPTNFDQPHNLSVFSNLKVSRRLDISVNFLYNTGRPITYPESTYLSDGIAVANYSERNKFRIPDYHRLDLSFHLGSSLKRNKSIEANWTLTLYNVYGRRNAYSVFFRSSSDLNGFDAYKLSIIGEIVPALTYNFKF